MDPTIGIQRKKNKQQSQTKITSKPQILQMITFPLVTLNLHLERIILLTSYAI
jgi:hypothetical protein